jgi:hypothetical protein
MAFASPRVSRVEHGLSLLPGPVRNASVWTCIQRSVYQQARRQAGRAACPSVVIMDGQSVKTTERGGIPRIRCAQARERTQAPHSGGHLWAAHRMQSGAADISDRKAAALLLSGLRPLFPNIRTVIADAGHQSARAPPVAPRRLGKLQIVKRRQRAFKIHSPQLDCGAQLRLAWPQSTIEQGFRVLRAEL